MDIQKIVNEAIPQESCPRKEAAAKNRRRVLQNRITDIQEGRDRSQPFMPPLEYKQSDNFGHTNVVPPSYKLKIEESAQLNEHLTILL